MNKIYVVQKVHDGRTSLFLFKTDKETGTPKFTHDVEKAMHFESAERAQIVADALNGNVGEITRFEQPSKAFTSF
jgi:hypothetical protein